MNAEMIAERPLVQTIIARCLITSFRRMQRNSEGSLQDSAKTSPSSRIPSTSLS
jgi:hypothetical protein